MSQDSPLVVTGAGGRAGRAALDSLEAAGGERPTRHREQVAVLSRSAA
ncbi:hypothetical protein [Kineosporia sp. NBRC 101677]|nr:hypothetical protein [Kineosporia sp. NBRC 101677]